MTPELGIPSVVGILGKLQSTMKSNVVNVSVTHT